MQNVERGGNRGKSDEPYAPTIDIPEDMCEYDQIRQKNIEERQRKFQELGLTVAKNTVSNTLKVTKGVKSTWKGNNGGK